MEIRDKSIPKSNSNQNDSDIGEIGSEISAGKAKDLLKKLIQLLNKFKW